MFPDILTLTPFSVSKVMKGRWAYYDISHNGSLLFTVRLKGDTLLIQRHPSQHAHSYYICLQAYLKPLNLTLKEIS
jgi:hypothetical protein